MWGGNLWSSIFSLTWVTPIGTKLVSSLLVMPNNLKLEISLTCKSSSFTTCSLIIQVSQPESTKDLRGCS